MAMINGKWLDRPEREERMKLVRETLRKLSELIKAGKATDFHFDQMKVYKAELAKLKRVHRAEVDIAYFTYEYLSDEHNPENENNIIMHDEDGTPHDPIEQIAQIHREFFDLCDHVNVEKRNARLAIAAARGHSKSGVFSNAFPLHQVVFRKRKYIQIISETDDLSKKLISWINKQLKFNAKLHDDFGVLLRDSKTQNEKDNENGFITDSDTMVEAKSAGKQLRGSRHGSRRPDLVIIDDPSSVNNEGTKDARAKLLNWFNTVVMPIGSKSTAIVLVGTMVSATGLLNHVLKRKDFKSSFHGAIIREPDNPKLWEQYCEIYSREDEENTSESDAFYEANKEALEAGVELAWPWRWTYRALMHEKVNMGTKAYNSEYRNLAFSEDEQFFFPERYAKYHYVYVNGVTYISFEEMRIPVNELTIVGAWDIAMGKNKRSDYNSVVVLGRYERTGHIFVLDEYSSKEKPHIFMDVIIERIRRWYIRFFNVETINAYHEFFRQLQDRVRLENLLFCRINDVKGHKASKEERIESMEPVLQNRTLVLNDRHELLLDQMAQYPFCEHDDALDALQLALDNISKPKARIVEKPSWLY